MAEQDDALDGAADGVVMDDAALANQNDQQQDEPRVADIASKMGWVPKDQFRGDPDKWRPADEFILAGHDIKQTVSRELKHVKQEVERFGRVAADMTERQLAEQKARWESQVRQATVDGDEEAVLALSTQRPASPRQEAGPPPEAQEWAARNPWFNSDPLAKVRAIELSQRLAASGVTDVPTQLQEVERAIRKEFPEHFPAAVKNPPSVQSGQSRKAAPSNRERGFADMPAESQQMARDMNRRNPGVTLEAIAKSYWADVQNQGRA